jgi:hypothetical protein
MMMLRELQAFEACWLDLKDTYPTSQQDNTLIAHAMGQLVDSLKKPAEIEQDLPDHLQILFRRLALAYFQGYFPSRKCSLKAAPEKAHLSVTVSPPPPVKCPEISAAVARVKTLAQQAQERMEKSRAKRRNAEDFHEMETLIIEFPEHWQADHQAKP